MARFACVLDTRQQCLVSRGYALQLSNFCEDTLDYMFTINSNPEFSPEFSSRHARFVYEMLVKLQSWYFPEITMVYLPSNDRVPALDTSVCKKFVKNFQGEAIVNGCNTYMVCKPDRMQASAMCEVYFTKKLHHNVSFGLYWRWPRSIDTYQTNGVWFDLHTGPLAAPVPTGMEVCSSLSDFVQRMKKSLSNFYLANSQELDFVMMRDVLASVADTGSTCQLLGLITPVGSLPTARMNGRPFLFFCWWNKVIPNLPGTIRNACRRPTPPVGATLAELSAALQNSHYDSSYAPILTRAVDAWHYTHWPGVEYTVCPPPPRIKEINVFQGHHCENKDVFVRSCNGSYSIRVSHKTPGIICSVSRGGWSALCRTGMWCPVPSEVCRSSDHGWTVSLHETGRFSSALHVFSAVDPVNVAATLKKMKHPLSKMGLFLTASANGITCDLAALFTGLIGRPHIITPENRNADAALALALDCYHDSVNSPSPVKFTRVRERSQLSLCSERFLNNLDIARRVCPPTLSGILYEFCQAFSLLVSNAEKMRKARAGKKRKFAD